MAPAAPERFAVAAGAALVELGRGDPALFAVDGGGAAETGVDQFRATFPDRVSHSHESGASALLHAIGKARSPAPVFVSIHPGVVVAQYDQVFAAANDGTVRLRLLSVPLERPTTPGAGGSSREDVAILRSVPRLTIVVPSDAATAASAIRAVGALPGAAYIRFPSQPLPSVGDGRFEIGRARLLRDGSDLTIVALGGTVRLALDAAQELERVGTHARVLDLLSVKPFDVKAVVRAARETGAILTLEEANAVSGLGSLVAATTSESEPVPVRRLGAPDLAPPPLAGGACEPWLTKERVLEEAWELLRMRGKVQ